MVVQMGITCHTMYESAYENWADARVVEYARVDGSTIVTRDKGSYTKRLPSGEQLFPYGSHNGIIRLSHQDTQRCLAALRRLLDSPHVGLVKGAICILQEQSAEIRYQDRTILLTGDRFDNLEQRE